MASSSDINSFMAAPSVCRMWPGSVLSWLIKLRRSNAVNREIIYELRAGPGYQGQVPDHRRIPRIQWPGCFHWQTKSPEWRPRMNHYIAQAAGHAHGSPPSRLIGEGVPRPVCPGPCRHAGPVATAMAGRARRRRCCRSLRSRVGTRRGSSRSHCRAGCLAWLRQPVRRPRSPPRQGVSPDPGRQCSASLRKGRVTFK